ncbi:Heat shock protein 60 family co-chaperone GroES [Candidatus Nasuia deltocephalinicola]|nr:Heat shock protein 60 family co-chaperone GroES [Candidatus Nasuia deltocephalinicola]
MNIKPINNRILLKKNNNIKNSSGIIISNADKDLPSEGIIFALNNEDIIIKSELKIGDHVLFNKYCGQELKINNENFIIIKKEDIIAILN